MDRGVPQPGERCEPARLAAAIAGALAAVALWALGPAAPGALACSNETHCADVSISGHAEPQPIRKGETSELKITPKNDGPGPAYGIDVQIDVPHQLEIEDVQIYGGRSGCTVDGTYVRCDMGDFVREQLGVIRIRVKGTEVGTFISQARVYSQGVEDPNGGNGQVSMTIGVLARDDPGDGGGGGGDGGGGGGDGDGGTGDGDGGIGDGGGGGGDGGGGDGGGSGCSERSSCADVAVSGGPESRRIRKGETSELKIRPKNKGPATAYGIDLQIEVPKQLKIKRVEAYGDRGGCDRDGNFIRCDMGDFVDQQLGVVRVKVKAKRRGKFVTEAHVYSQGVTDPKSRNDKRRMPIRVG